MATDTAQLDQLVQGNAAFALDLYHALRNAPGNLFFSPFSVSSCLAMALLGAKGDTASQLASGLHVGSETEDTHVGFRSLQEKILAENKTGKIDVRIANQIWPDKRLHVLPEFVERLERYYQSGIQEVDFADAGKTCQLINDWVGQATNALINKIVGEDDICHSVLVLANAIYFKGKWSTPFKTEATTHGPFYLAPRQAIQVPMMSQFAPAAYAKKRGVEILEKSYGTGEFSMVVLLPEQLETLDSLEASLTPEHLGSLLTDLEPQEEMHILLPKFRIASQYELTDPLMGMGIVDAFSANADFSRMTGTGGIFVSRVIHEAVIEVEEAGTEAAAVTATTFFTGLPDLSRLRVFSADHPFVFLIRHNPSGSILFLGRVVDPR